MKKNILSLLLLAGTFSAANAQTYKGRVGVNTPTPASTMDIVGVPADDTVTDGLIAPRLTGDELKAKDNLYTSAQTGALVYATAAVGTATTKTANVTSAGYYWFDGTVWVKAGYGTPFRLQSDNTDAHSNKTNTIYREGYVQVGVKSTTKTINPWFAETALTAISRSTDNNSTSSIFGTFSRASNETGNTLTGTLNGGYNYTVNDGATGSAIGTRSYVFNYGTFSQMKGLDIYTRQGSAATPGTVYGLYNDVYNDKGSTNTFGQWNVVGDGTATTGTNLWGSHTAVTASSNSLANYSSIKGINMTVDNKGKGTINGIWGGQIIATEDGRNGSTTGGLYGLDVRANVNSTATNKITNIIALRSTINTVPANSATNMYGGYFSVSSSNPTLATATNAYGMYVYGVSGGTNSYGVYIDDYISGFSNAYAFYSASTRPSVFSAAVSGTAFNTSSDARLKRNITNVDNGINTIMKLRPVSYEKKSSLTSDDYGKVREIGFLAQEVQTVLPNVVSELTKDNGEKILGVNYTELIPVLTKAIQEQQKQIDELKKEVTELKAKVGR